MPEKLLPRYFLLYHALIEGFGCGKPFISSSKIDDLLHVPVESLMREIPQSTLQTLVVLCSQGATLQVVLVSVVWTLRNGSGLNTHEISTRSAELGLKMLL